MPAKAHRPNGQIRSHSRTSSGGSSKLGLNLQITQKDPPPARVSDKGKKSSHFHHEPTARAASAQFLRSNSGIRVHSRENLQPAALRRAPTPNAAAKQNGNWVKQKTGFSISNTDEGDDDDEWVSSESGAATPNNESDAEATPIEQASKQRPVSQPAPVQQSQPAQLNATNGHDIATPKAVPPSLPRVDTARPSQFPIVPAARDYAQQHEQREQATFASREPPPQTPKDQQQPHLDIQISSPTPPVNKARSETHSPPRRSPDIEISHKRQSMTRPPSTHSITSSNPLKPHPLIRARPSSQGALAAKPAPLAPLTTVLPDAASGQMSTASSSPTSLHTGSPTSIRTAAVSPSLSSPTSSSARKQLRRTSTSSVASSATMPVQPSVSERLSGRSNHDRQRTLSTMSSSSSIAALTSFALRSAPSTPRTPITLTSHFPRQEQSAALEMIHPLLPPPYLSAHLTVLAYRNPMAESYDRVIRAKPGR